MQGMARTPAAFADGSMPRPTVLIAAFCSTLILQEFWTAATTPPTADNPNSVVQIDFSRQFDEIDIPECARNQVINVTLADQEIACLLPRRMSSGIMLLDRLERFLSVTPEADPDMTPILDETTNNERHDPSDCKMPTRLSHELHVGSPELQSYMRAARLRWLLDRCFRFSDVGVKDWRYELCIGCVLLL